MRALAGTILGASLLLCLNRPSWACTIFKVTRQGMTLVGNNEDDNNPDTKVWFLAPEKGKFGRVFFGYNDAIPQGGMNDRGLFFDWVADNTSDDWKRDPQKLNYAGSVSEKILEEASSVEEALRFYERYNETAFLKSRTMLVDKTGASAIVGWHDGKVKTVRGAGRLQAMGWGGEIAQRKLNETDNPSVQSTISILEACVQSGEYPTQYSNIYDLQQGEVYVFLFHQKKPFVKLDLRQELSRGHHYYNVSLIAAQIHQPPMTDHKTQRAADIDPAIYSRYVGRYRIEPDYVFTITAEDGRLYYDAKDASRIEILPASSTRFFLRSLEGYVLFEPAENGQADQAILHVRGKDIQAERIK
jgi:hypothetical protein